MSAIVFAGGQTFSFGAAEYSNGGLFGPMTLPYVQLLAVFEGRAQVVSDDGAFEIRAGEIALIVNRGPVTFLYPRDVKTGVGWCETAPPAISNPDVGPLRSGPSIVGLDDRIRKVLDLGIGLGAAGSTGVNELRNAIGQALFSAFALGVQESDDVRSFPQPVLRAKAFINSRFKDPISVSEVAKHSNVSRQHLTTIFPKHLGLTPSRYIWHVRASQGAAMLMQTGRPIAEIAYECGYQDPFHFSRNIKAAFGKTPRELRMGKGFRQSSLDLEEMNNIAFDKQDP